MRSFVMLLGLRIDHFGVFASSLSSTTMDSQSSTSYKGKVTNRGWSQLPAELIRTIATNYLWDVSSTKHCPDTWNHRVFWQSRLVYTVLRDAVQMETFMQICPQWAAAVEHHNFWDHAINVIDPRDVLIMHSFTQPPNAANSMTKASAGTATIGMAQPKHIKLSPFAHFKAIAHWSCIVCCINHPQSNHGLGKARYPFYHTLTGNWGLCPEHNGGPDRPSARDRSEREHERDRERSTFCGLCLREAQPYDLHIQYGYGYGYGQQGLQQGMDIEKSRRNPTFYTGCMENEDENTFPNVETTCRSCRQEWLMARIHQLPEYRWYRDRVRLTGGKSGLPRLEAWDWDHEARSSVESFIELGEGSVDDIVALVRDRWWLRTKTRLGGMLEQAIAAEKFLGGETTLPGTGRSRGRTMRDADGDLDVDEEIEEDTEEEEEEEEDTELLQITEDSGVRDLALSDWARRRILDGFWISPADQWYKYFLPPTPGSPAPLFLNAVHPCPWSLESNDTDSDPLSPTSTDLDTTEATPPTHPLPSTIHSSVPPSFHLCEEAYSAFQKEFRLVLLPGMRNLVRRLVIESHAASVEAAKLGVPPNPKLGDPAIRASRMTIEDVVRELRECEGVWWDGWDWVRHGEHGEGGNSRKEVEGDTGMNTSRTTAESDGDSGSCRHEDEQHGHGHGRHDEHGHGNGNGNGHQHTHVREGSEKSSSDESSTPTSTSTLTSPVLSTSTLGTTPSPPPTTTHSGDEKEKDGNCNNVSKADSPSSVSVSVPMADADADADAEKTTPTHTQTPAQSQSQVPVKEKPVPVPISIPAPGSIVVKPITIPISPVLDPPRMLRPIPYIPVSIAHLPQYSLELVKNVWREACAPLYHCRCRICIRAAEKANAALAANNPLNSISRDQKERWDELQNAQNERQINAAANVGKQDRDRESQLVQIRLEEADDVDADTDADGTPVRVEYLDDGDGDGEVEELDYASEEAEYEDEYYEDDEDARSDICVVGTKGGRTQYVEDDGEYDEEVDEDAKLRAYRKSRERDRYTRSRSPEIPSIHLLLKFPDEKGDDEKADRPSSTYSSHETLVANSPPSTPVRRIPGSRKRSCDEVDGLQGDDVAVDGGVPSTPPKRQRLESPGPLASLGLFPVPAEPASPARKRSSEEIDLEANAEESYERGVARGYDYGRKHALAVDAGGGGGKDGKDGHRNSERKYKRFKTSSSEEEEAETPPRSMTGDSDPEERGAEVKV
ncbi:hypothetical protein D9758_008780 [Tetrapyrgos nigripes]|uniref:Uncharacterized protein n=1 Tax=Tetrapyrgos nigripes TaxID=182062 RepID=A0A8H5FXS6_9AGAR|nr:hypothetical protein D9758_008780 [Tetrapyrgos nigripes]